MEEGLISSARQEFAGSRPSSPVPIGVDVGPAEVLESSVAVPVVAPLSSPHAQSISATRQSF